MVISGELLCQAAGPEGLFCVLGLTREEGSPEELGLSMGLLEVLMGRGWG